MKSIAFAIPFLYLLNVVGGQTYSSVIHVDNGLIRGVWGVNEFCPVNSYAAGMEIKNQERGNVDDTCVNGLKLYCFDKDTGMLVSYITSLEGKFGDWQGIRQCPLGDLIVGYSLNLEGDVGPLDDDLGVMDIRAQCENGTILNGLPVKEAATTRKRKEDAEEILIVQNGVERKAYKTLIHKLTDEEIARHKKLRGKPYEGEIGIWGNIATCPINTFVCGLKTRVEDEDLINDDAGLCDVLLFCCE